MKYNMKKDLLKLLCSQDALKTYMIKVAIWYTLFVKNIKKKKTVFRIFTYKYFFSTIESPSPRIFSLHVFYRVGSFYYKFLFHVMLILSYMLIWILWHVCMYLTGYWKEGKKGNYFFFCLLLFPGIQMFFVT